MSRHHIPLSQTLMLAGVAAGTTWFTLLSWRNLSSNASEFSIPLFFIGALVALIGAVARSARLPAAVIVLAQIIVAAACVLGTVTGSITPTAGTLAEFTAAFRDGLESAQLYVAPVPVGVPPIFAILLTCGAATLVAVDFLACTLKRSPLAGLMLLTSYSVPVAITGNGLPWWAFIVASTGFLAMLYLAHGERVSRWGRGVSDEEGADPSGFGVRTGAIRGSALAIGTTATTLALALPIMVPTLDITLFDGNGPGARKIEVLDPMVDLRRDLTRGDDIPLLWVNTPAQKPSYFRLSALTRFNGDTWTPGDRDIPESQQATGEMPPLLGVSLSAKREVTPYHLRVSSAFDSTWLPTTPQVSEMTAPGDWRYDTSTMDFMTTDEDTSIAGMTYSFTGVAVDPDPEVMDDSVSGASLVSSRYLEVPGNVAGEIRSLAAAVTSDAPTRFRKAQALQQWFREDGGFRYSLEAADGADRGNLSSFLDESGRVGYCEQFAASMAIMARILGIPARVAVGFLDSRPAGPNQWEFSAWDLHAWPELFFPGAGWVRFEPTPSARAPETPAYTSAELIPDSSQTSRPSATRSSDLLPSRGASPAIDAGTDGNKDGSIPWLTISLVAAIVVLLLVLLVLPALLRRRRRERRLLGDIEDLWLELRDHAIDLGHDWPYGRSPRAMGVWLGALLGPVTTDSQAERPRHGRAQNPEASLALDSWVEQLERARYSLTPSPLNSERAAHHVQVIEVALDHGVGPRVRRRARWLPRSLRRASGPSTPEVVAQEAEDAVRS